MAKWYEDMEIEPPTKSCTAKQASLDDVWIQVVPHKKRPPKAMDPFQVWLPSMATHTKSIAGGHWWAIENPITAHDLKSVYNIVNPYNIVKEKCYNIDTENLAIYSPTSLCCRLSQFSKNQAAKLRKSGKKLCGTNILMNKNAGVERPEKHHFLFVGCCCSSKLSSCCCCCCCRCCCCCCCVYLSKDSVARSLSLVFMLSSLVNFIWRKKKKYHRWRWSITCWSQTMDMISTS